MFDLVKEIGQNGQNSRTFIANDHQLNAEIVIKQIAKTKLSSPAEFFEESKALYASAHPNVVQVHYACYDAESVFVAMPYYKNGSAKELITGKHMTIREIVVAGCQVLSGLHNIHSKKLVHFDVKPDNILLSDRREALVGDFGQAKQMNFSGIASQDRHYGPMIPPEATKGDKFDLTFDIYQFGLALYRMCNGNEAFAAQLTKYGDRKNFDRAAFRFDVINGRFPDRKAFAPHVPERMRKIIRKSLEVDPANRYPSAIDVANALAQVDGSTLDWRLSESGGNKIWNKNENGTLYELVLQPDGKCKCKKSKNGNKAVGVSDGCSTNMTDKELSKFFGAY